MSKDKQVRGDDLRDKIEAGIKELAAEAKIAKKKYVYNATQLAAKICTTRATLTKHNDVVDKALKELAGQRRVEKGEGALQTLREKVERLELEAENMKKELEVLRNHHAEIYQKVYYNAGDLEPLVRPIVEEEMFDADRCILCLHKIEEIGEPETVEQKPRKVITLHPQKGKGRNPGK